MPTFTMHEGSDKERKKRKAIIEKIFPVMPIIQTSLEPELMSAMKQPLIDCLKREIEIYKAYPKKGNYDPTKFNPTNNRTCFMGQAFKANGHGFEGWEDGELADYRKKIGTIKHKEWGACTLLEIWGGDHFRSHNEMVVAVFKYCWGEIPELPQIEFHVNPFYKNSKSGKFESTIEQKHEKNYAIHLTKIASYIEIKNRMKKSKVKNPLELEPQENEEL